MLPQTGQVPLVAFRPFFILTEAGLRISRIARHFMQNATTGPSKLRCTYYPTCRRSSKHRAAHKTTILCDLASILHQLLGTGTPENCAVQETINFAWHV